jgi:hypothetical protein
VSARQSRENFVSSKTGCSGAQLEGRKMCRRMYATGAARPCGTKEKCACRPTIFFEHRGSDCGGYNAHHISQPQISIADIWVKISTHSRQEKQDEMLDVILFHPHLDPKPSLLPHDKVNTESM